MMRFIVATLLTATAIGSTDGAGSVQSSTTQRPTALFSYNEVTLDDGRRARLVNLMPRLYPVEQWWTIAPRDGERIRGLVSRIYFPEGPDGPLLAFRQTADALVSQVARANSLDRESPLSPNRPVRVPPLPPVTSGLSSEKSRRVTEQGVQWTTDNWKTWSTSTGWAEASFASRGAEFSQLELASNVASEAVLELNSLGTFVDDERLVLLEAPSLTSGCSPASEWVTASPYYPRALQRVLDRKSDILLRASTRPLVLLDFNFDGGHGAAVLSAARTLLEDFKVPELAELIRRIELNPAADGGTAKVPLQTLFNEYLVQYGRRNGVNDSIAAPGSHWIQTSSTGTNGAAATIDSVVLQAAMWKASRLGSWWNLSWWTRRQGVIYPPVWQSLIGSAFGVVAAGNDGKELGPDMEPQRNSSTFLNWINVTYGTPGGVVSDGTRTSLVGLARVETIGPGCGHVIPPLTSDNAGSSYASPYVAAAAWLKHLLDDTGVGVMRAHVLRASRFERSAVSVVESAGVFDAARLLSDVGSHLLTTSGVEGVTSASATIQAGTCGDYSSATLKGGSVSLTRDSAGRVWAHVRKPLAALPGVALESCEVQPAKFSVTVMRADGTSRTYTMAEFLGSVREVVF